MAQPASGAVAAGALRMVRRRRVIERCHPSVRNRAGNAYMAACRVLAHLASSAAQLPKMIRYVASIRTLRQSGARRHSTFLPINDVEMDVMLEHRRRIAGEDAARSGLMAARSGLMFVCRCDLAS